MSFEPFLTAAIDARSGFFAEPHTTGFRLFNGFTEGAPQLALDVYGKTLVVNDHSESTTGDEATVKRALEIVRERLPWLTSALWKVRNAKDEGLRNGSVLFGTEKDLARRIVEDGVTYALDLRLNRDSSLYLDTRELRSWAKKNLNGKRVLNTFSYTGSLGVAARAGGAVQVMHTDFNNAFLSVAKDSYSMNTWPIAKRDFRLGDFFDVMGQLKRDDELFDCVFVDPPYFSVTVQGRVDLAHDMDRVLNKARPLVAHNGYLVVVNNGLFVSGAGFLTTLTKLCDDGYMTIEERVGVPDDFLGYPTTKQGSLPVDPAPFVHSTKMAILSVRRKDGRGVAD